MLKLQGGSTGIVVNPAKKMTDISRYCLFNHISLSAFENSFTIWCH